MIGIKQVYNATGEMFHLVELPEYRNETDPLPAPTMPKTGKTQMQPAEPEPLQGEILPMQAYEKLIIQKAIEAADGNLASAAEMLGISRATIYNKVKKYQL